MTIALISALTGTPVRHDVAMTGEITLRGRVFTDRRTAEKTMACSKRHTPYGDHSEENNVSDLAEIDQTVRQNLHFVSTDHVDKILDVALLRQPSESASDYLPLSAEQRLPVRI